MRPEFSHNSMLRDSEYCKKAIIEIIEHDKSLDRIFVKSLVGPDGHNLLHYAAFHGDIESAQILLNNQLSINSLDKDGDSALSNALQAGKTDFAKFLLEKGANIHEYNGFGYTPLQEITLRREVDNENRIKALEFLLQNGADPELPVKKCSPGFTASGGKTAGRHEGRKITDILATASDWNQMQAKEVVELIKKLYEFGANIRTKEEYENQHNIRKPSKAKEITKGIFETIIPENILERDKVLLENKDLINALKKFILAGNLIEVSEGIAGKVRLEALKSITPQELIENSEKLKESGLYSLLEKIDKLPDDVIIKTLSQKNTDNLKAELKKSILDGNIIVGCDNRNDIFNKTLIEALRSITKEELETNSTKIKTKTISKFVLESTFYNLLESLSDDNAKSLSDDKILEQLSRINRDFLGLDVTYAQRLELFGRHERRFADPPEDDIQVPTAVPLNTQARTQAPTPSAPPPYNPSALAGMFDHRAMDRSLTHGDVYSDSHLYSQTREALPAQTQAQTSNPSSSFHPNRPSSVRPAHPSLEAGNPVFLGSRNHLEELRRSSAPPDDTADGRGLSFLENFFGSKGR